MDLRGQRRRPRVCVVGEWSKEERDGLSALFESLTFHDNATDMFEAWAPAEIDLAVLGETVAENERRNSAYAGVSGPLPTVELSRLDRCHVVLFGAPTVTKVRFHHERHVFLGKAAASAEHTIREPPGHAARVLRGQMKGVHDVRRWTTLRLQPLSPMMPGTTAPSEREIKERQLAAGAESVFGPSALVSATIPEAPLAIATIRADTGMGFAWLPNFRENRVAWVESLVNDWAEKDRQAFAAIAPWREQREWRTAEEVSILEALDDVERQRAQFLARLDAEQADLEERLRNVARAADHFERTLLTAKGNELVGGVASVLRGLGFVVCDMDTQKVEGEPKLEDLRITHPRRPGWEALVEVKGHDKRGLALADVSQARRPRDRYRDKAGRWPDRVLLVINGEAGKPPSGRSEPFATDPDQVRALESEDFWLIVPTRTLFHVYRDRVALGDQAADLLMHSAGILRLPGRGQS